jgi:hypothetical protein
MILPRLSHDLKWQEKPQHHTAIFLPLHGVHPIEPRGVEAGARFAEPDKPMAAISCGPQVLP